MSKELKMRRISQNGIGRRQGVSSGFVEFTALNTATKYNFRYFVNNNVQDTDLRGTSNSVEVQAPSI
jgi:hypothetical protein